MDNEGTGAETRNDGEQKSVSSPSGENDLVEKNKDSDENMGEVTTDQNAGEKEENESDKTATENEDDTTNAVDIVQALEGTMRDYLDRLGVNQEHAMDWQDTFEESAHSIQEAERLLRECINRNKPDGNESENSEIRFYRENRLVGDIPSEFGVLADQLERRIRRSMKRHNRESHKREQSSYDYTKRYMRTIRERQE